MRYALKIEAIGDNYAYHLRQFNKRPHLPFTKREIRSYQLGGPHLRPWVARITGVTANGQFTREFVDGQKDYSFANGSGSRGIYFYYFLEPGLYEINERKTWKRAERYFAWIVNNSTLCKLTREEAFKWLRANGF